MPTHTAAGTGTVVTVLEYLTTCVRPLQRTSLGVLAYTTLAYIIAARHLKNRQWQTVYSSYFNYSNIGNCRALQVPSDIHHINQTFTRYVVRNAHTHEHSSMSSDFVRTITHRSRSTTKF